MPYSWYFFVKNPWKFPIKISWKTYEKHVNLHMWIFMGFNFIVLVGTIKGALEKSIGKICLTEKKLETFLAEAEAVINSRPLVYVGEDLEMEIWGKDQQQLNSLWKVWKDDYLERRQTHPRIQAAEEPKVGSTVLSKEDLPRDGKIQAVKVLLPTKKVLNGPLNLLYPLECDSGREIEMTQDGEQLKETEEITSKTLRPTRAAAIRAREQMQQLLSSEIGTLSCLGSVAEFRGELKTS